VPATCGLRYLARGRYGELRGSVDTMLVMGGLGVAAAARDAALRRWLVRWAPRVRRMGSVCTGAFVLAAAGLLDGRRAATHWQWADELARRFPKVAVDGDAIFVKDRSVYTSAGVTAGIDLALAMVEEDFGGAVALQIAKELVLYLRRAGGQSQFSAMLPAAADGGDRFAGLRTWAAEHLRNTLRVDELAEAAAMSPRHFARVFHAETGQTPAKFVESLRLEAACRRLEQGRQPLKTFAAASGFGGPDSMRRAFVRRLQVTPDQYRAHFRLRRDRAGRSGASPTARR
jgi:transcriptional regulator GlxA family with amidase domain